MRPKSPARRAAGTISFLGPAGTFTEEALFTQADYAVGAHVSRPLRSTEALEAVAQRSCHAGLRAHRELDRGRRQRHRRQSGLRGGPAHPTRGGPRRPPPPGRPDPGPSSRPSRGCCRSRWHRPNAGVTSPTHLPDAEVVATNSTAEAARLVGAGPATAAPPPWRTSSRPSSTASRSSPTAWRTTPNNQTRFVALAPHRAPGPHGARQDEHRVLPARGPPGKPARDPE